MRTSLPVLLVSLMTSLGAAFACGDSGGDDLFAGPGGPPGGAGASTGGGAGGGADGSAAPADGGGAGRDEGAGSGGGGAPAAGGGGAVPDAGTPDEVVEDGSAPPGDAAEAVGGFVACSGENCSLAAGEICCVTRSSAGPFQGSTTTFECSTTEAECNSARLRCDADHDCPAGQLCCLSTASGVQTYSCASECGSTHVACSGASDCDAGEICCGERQTGAFSGTSYTRLECRSSCDGLNSPVVFCRSSEDCPPATPSCEPSDVLRGLAVCR